MPLAAIALHVCSLPSGVRLFAAANPAAEPEGQSQTASANRFKAISVIGVCGMSGALRHGRVAFVFFPMRGV